MLQVSELYIYPIKSLKGIKVTEALVTDRGFKYDRRWMLVDANNRFISQRELPEMALLSVNIANDHLAVVNTVDNASIDIPFAPQKQAIITVYVWDDVCTGQLVNDAVDNWFTQQLGTNCRLVYMPDESIRFTDPQYSVEDLTSFSDGYPFLLAGQASMDDLNKRLSMHLKIDRFRPNIVFKGGVPFQEDTINSFSINDIHFNGVKLCARCPIITIDQDTAVKGKEPAKTLASYRFKNNNVYFGQNLIHSGTGTIKIGDELVVLSLHSEERFIITKKIH
jgi:uncharacterized protein YcbX